ncbi:MAG: dihydropyrimidine dehydrogenase, partial [Clostridia bacterium]|nr:dihydropyrimidine dehydrogenase [Clostridia bacterium]
MENRNPIPTQSPEERIHNFKEVALGYDMTMAQSEAARCLNCKNAPCMSGCPVGV